MQNYSLAPGLIPEINQPRFLYKELSDIRIGWGSSNCSIDEERDLTTLLDNATFFTGGIEILQDGSSTFYDDVKYAYIRAAIDLTETIKPCQTPYLEYKFGAGQQASLNMYNEAKGLMTARSTYLSLLKKGDISVVLQFMQCPDLIRKINARKQEELNDYQGAIQANEEESKDGPSDEQSGEPNQDQLTTTGSLYTPPADEENKK